MEMEKGYGRLGLELKKRRERIVRDLDIAREASATAVSSSDEKTYSNHLADEASVTLQQEENLALERHLQRELDAIDDALQRIRDGSYGRCQRCGQPIGDERLEALPTATLCITCKASGENRR